MESFQIRRRLRQVRTEGWMGELVGEQFDASRQWK
jgi:hypothetical protein